MKKALVLILPLLLTAPAWAADTAHADPRTVEKLLEVSHAENVSKQLQAQIRALLTQQAQQMDAAPADQPIVDKYMKQLSATVLPSLDWRKLKPELVKIYSDTFTDKEVADLIRFYQSDTGQAYLRKAPELNKQTLLLMQSSLQALLPKVQDLSRRMGQELQSRHATPTAIPKK
ncbi:MAG TPA: DUF2059 domain-containing protein [Stenotrophobium sp.]|jgi:hypothetical protein|nr:DUF2059 domain-containing protein [Stenotrophobium sp.]